MSSDESFIIEGDLHEDVKTIESSLEFLVEEYIDLINECRELRKQFFSQKIDWTDTGWKRIYTQSLSSILQMLQIRKEVLRDITSLLYAVKTPFDKRAYQRDYMRDYRARKARATHLAGTEPDKTLRKKLGLPKKKKKRQAKKGEPDDVLKRKLGIFPKEDKKKE